MTELSKPEIAAGPATGGVRGSPQPVERSLFGAALAPALLSACDGRLVDVHWFRADWQRGGALTGYAEWIGDDGAREPVVVKLPVPPQELLWLERLQRHEDHPVLQVAPRLLAGGRTLDGYDLAWAVMQRLRHGPLDHHWQGHEIELLADAAARFYVAAERFPADQPVRSESWANVFKRSRQALKDGELPESQRWNAALKAAQKRLDKLLAVWDGRDVSHWCHGDLHLGNAMTIAPPPDGPAILFDMAMVHTGHWIEDAVYFEHLFWSKPQRLGGHDFVRLLASHRKARGLRQDPNWPQLANIRRALLAAAAPAEQQGAQTNPYHLHAALVVLEKMLLQTVMH